MFLKEIVDPNLSARVEELLTPIAIPVSFLFLCLLSHYVTVSFALYASDLNRQLCYCVFD